MGDPGPRHDARAHSPHGAAAGRAHNCVELGAGLPGRPWTYLAYGARLSYRHRQLPARETCRTKTSLAVALWRQAEAESPAPLLAVFDGAAAVETVATPWLTPEGGRRRMELATRWRADARRDQPVEIKARAKGRPSRWGLRIVAPQHHLYWPVGWLAGRAWVSGRLRRCQSKQLRWRRAVSGPRSPVRVFVLAMEGDKQPWCLVTTALDLTAPRVGEGFTARWRQEEACRDHKQRRGMEDCRAWTPAPLVRTFPVQLVALTVLRLLQARLNQAWGPGGWWCKPEWKPHQCHGAILELSRLCGGTGQNVPSSWLASRRWKTSPTLWPCSGSSGGGLPKILDVSGDPTKESRFSDSAKLGFRPVSRLAKPQNLYLHCCSDMVEMAIFLGPTHASPSPEAAGGVACSGIVHCTTCWLRTLAAGCKLSGCRFVSREVEARS
jgi:hypothetical protein